MASSSRIRGWRRPHEDGARCNLFVNDNAHDAYNHFIRKGLTMIERNIDLSEFDSVGLHEQFAQRGWMGICSGHTYGLPILVAEFLANRSVEDTRSEEHTSELQSRRHNLV